jgi:hypothetical protein
MCRRRIRSGQLFPWRSGRGGRVRQGAGDGLLQWHRPARGLGPRRHPGRESARRVLQDESAPAAGVPVGAGAARLAQRGRRPEQPPGALRLPGAGGPQLRGQPRLLKASSRAAASRTAVSKAAPPGSSSTTSTAGPASRGPSGPLAAGPRRRPGRRRGGWTPPKGGSLESAWDPAAGPRLIRTDAGWCSLPNGTTTPRAARGPRRWRARRRSC